MLTGYISTVGTLLRATAVIPAILTDGTNFALVALHVKPPNFIIEFTLPSYIPLATKPHISLRSSFVASAGGSLTLNPC